jgi:RHS repeat-associated protein
MQVRALLAIALCVCGLSSAQAARQTRTSSFDYDGVTGLLIRETIEPDQPNLCLTTTYTYDTYGNKQAAATANCGTATGDAVIETRTSTTSFGPDGRFAVSATNTVGQTETRQFDSKFGGAIALTGPNNLTTTWQYDVFGRKVLEVRSDGTSTRMEYVYCTGVGQPSEACAPPGATYFLRSTPQLGATLAGTPNGPIGKVYYDSLNREIRSETQGFNGNAVLAIFKDTKYNDRGQVLQVSKPYYSGDTPVWTTYAYDDVGRVLSETQPAPTAGAVPVVTQTTYNGLALTVTVSGNGTGAGLPGNVVQTRTTVKNSQGQTASVTDAAGNVITYQYDPFGNLLVTTAGGVNTTLSYDLRGRKIGMVDPDMGSWTYAYDVLGQLKRQTDAKGQVSTMVYDKLGRMTSRAEPDLISTWFYDTVDGTPSGAACGASRGRLCKVTSANDYSRSYHYDGQGRVDGVSTVIGATTYALDYTYDQNGRLDKTTYPQGRVGTPRFETRNGYHATLGSLLSVTNGAGNVTYWRATSVSATGKVLSESLGNGLAQTRGYDALDRLTSNSVGTLQSFTYTYDTIGNMTQRVDASQNNLTENFVYDSLNRLLQSSGTGLTTKSYSYNALGNITYKSDAGTYNYPAAGNYRPHAVSSITGKVNGVINPGFTYDANGNLTAGAGRTLTYTSFNMPLTINGSGYAYTYTYNADHERVRLQHSTLGEFIYLHPAGKGQLLYERESRPDGVVEHKNYINAGGSLVAVYLDRSNSTSDTRYFHTDHLGSVTLITNDQGAQVDRLAYDAFGMRRYPNGTDNPNNAIIPLHSDRGFTGHEHLDEIALIHMNGRIYDPMVGRFMTPDPLVQAPDNLQSYNRYSYVTNNPLGYIDPTGYSWWTKIRGIVVRVVAAVADVYLGCSGYCSAAVGGYQGYQQGGVLGGVVGAVAGYAGYQVGVNYPLTGAGSIIWENVATAAAINAGIGCASAAASGGNCATAALSGAAGTAGAAYGFMGSIIAGCAAGKITHGGCGDGAINAGGAYAVYSAIRYVVDAQRTSDNWDRSGLIRVAACDCKPGATRDDGPPFPFSGDQSTGNRASSNPLSELRYTAPGETYVRYEPGFPFSLAVSSVTLLGGVEPFTYAAPLSDGITSLRLVNDRYNLPIKFVDRTIYWVITPPAGTPIIGPRPVVGGSGNEVFFPMGAPPGSVKGPALPTPP